MRSLVTLLLVLLALNAWAQDWKEEYITVKGDTVRPGTNVKLLDVKSFEYVTPSRFFPTSNPALKQPISMPRYNHYREHLHMYMKEKVYPVHRLTRIKGSQDVYVEYATILVEDPRITHTNPVEYVIAIDMAQKYSEIEFVK